MKNTPLVVVEEIENGIHPSLYRSVFRFIDKLCKDKRILITTHSSAVTRYFVSRSFDSFYIGIPDDNKCPSGRATFLTLDPCKRDEIESDAREQGESIGELITNMISDSIDSMDKLRGWLRVRS